MRRVHLANCPQSFYCDSDYDVAHVGHEGVDSSKFVSHKQSVFPQVLHKSGRGPSENVSPFRCDKQRRR